MSSEGGNECTLNTTDCILNALTSIVDELRAKNDEYNWEPLTFAFTAAIGFIALFFAALTIGQALLAAGPGRLKSGAYAIGPWARLNVRRFDWLEMRFRTVSHTPVLIAQAIMRPHWGDQDGIQYRRQKYVLPDKTNHMSNYEASRQLKKPLEDYFPATWLALLTALGLDETGLWGVKSTGADYIPAEFSAVPAYGSIRAVIIIGTILSEGCGRIAIDSETNLPRIQGNGFNLIFRQHHLLGAVGFFEMHDPKQATKNPFQWPNLRDIRNTLLQANGYMDILKAGRGETAGDQQVIMGMYANEAEWIDIDQVLSCKLIDKVQSTCTCDGKNAHPYQLCCWQSPTPWPGCCKLIRDFGHWRPNLATNGPLYIVSADKPATSPIIFPHKRANFRRRLNTLFLQSRFWALNNSAFLELSHDPIEKFVKDEKFLSQQAMSSVVEIAQRPIKELKLTEQAYALCSANVSGIPNTGSDSRRSSRLKQKILEAELETIDTWLKNAKIASCRQMTLSVIGNAIQEMINNNESEGYRNSHIEVSNFVSGDLAENLYDFRQAFQDSNSQVYLFQRETSDKHLNCETARQELLESIQKLYNLWETEERQYQRERDGDEEEEPRQVFVRPYTNQHPLDDLLIYRSVLIVLLYSLAIDSSDLLEKDSYGLVVPIM
ncbi:hypothetical protein FALCPG4_018355 [Fusarium falciforme]